MLQQQGSPTALQEGKEECRNTNSSTAGLRKIWFIETHINQKKKKKKVFFLIWDFDTMQPNDIGHTAKQQLQGCKQGKSLSRMKVDSVDCSSPPQSLALPAPADLVLTFF